MYFDGLYIDENQVAQFMNDVKPNSYFRVEMDGCYWVFAFTEAADYEEAVKWDYAHNPRYYMNNNNYIYFDTDADSFAYSMFGQVVTGFNSADDAEEAYFDKLVS